MQWDVTGRSCVTVLSELFWKKLIWAFAGFSQILWHRTLLPLWDSCFSTTCVLLSTSAYFLWDVWTSSFEALFPLQLPNSIRKCIHSFLRLLIPLTTRDKISPCNQLGSMCPSIRLCVQSHGQDAGVSHAEGSAAYFWGGGIHHPNEILEVLCPSWNAWEMIMHWLGLWVSCRRTLDALSSGPFPLPLVCSRIYQFHSSQAQLIPETWQPLCQPVVHLLQPSLLHKEQQHSNELFFTELEEKHGEYNEERESWRGKVNCESTWEMKFSLKRCFPFSHFH